LSWTSDLSSPTNTWQSMWRWVAELIVPSRCCEMPMAAALVSASQSPLVDIRGCKRKAVFLILAVTPEKKLRTKSQLIRRSTEHLEAVA